SGACARGIIPRLSAAPVAPHKRDTSMAFVIAPAPVAAVPVKGGNDQFPIHRIYCVGRNYVEHAIEMGHSGREAPFFCMKSADAVLALEGGAMPPVGTMYYPSLTKSLHHEVELVVAIGKGGRNIQAVNALDHVWGYGV